MILESVLGILLLVGVVLGVAALLKRFAGFDRSMAFFTGLWFLLLLFIGYFLWACVIAGYCGKMG
jgi:hypothetical protein